MKIGNGKQGVVIGESCSPSGSVEHDNPDSNPIMGYIEPAGDQPQWIMWFMRNGDAVLYTERSYENGINGAVLGEPLRISNNHSHYVASQKEYKRFEEALSKAKTPEEKQKVWIMDFREKT